MTISYHILVAEVVTLQTFNYYVSNAMEVNQIVVIVKYTTKKSVAIAVTESQMLINLKNLLLQLKSLLEPQANAQEQQRKGQDVEI
jgi:hypothetical protein